MDTLDKYLQSGTISCSISRVQRDHSSCTAVMGWTACALLIVSGLASDNPMYLIFPSWTSLLSSPICHSKKTEQTYQTQSHQINNPHMKKRSNWWQHSRCLQWVKLCQHGADNRDQCSWHQGVGGYPRNRTEHIQGNRSLSHYHFPFWQSQTLWQSEIDLEESPWEPES